MTHSIAISDIHLSQIEPTNGLWMRYRQAPFITDAGCIAMLDAARERANGDPIELVLNGDIFDFDAPWVENGKTRMPDERRDAETTVTILRGILRDHAPLFDAIGRILANGGSVIFIAGNHDVDLIFDEARQELRQTLAEAARTSGSTEDREALGSRISFRAWFYLNRHGVLFEHGHQYDETNSYLTIATPVTRSATRIAPTFGSLVSRYLSSRLGYINPHVEDSYMRSFFGYMGHGIRYYLFSSRSMALTFVRGTWKTVIELLHDRIPDNTERRKANVLAALRETGLDHERISKHLALTALPLDTDMAKVFRSVTRSKLDDVWKRVNDAMRDIAVIHNATAVVFGHTHRAYGTWENGIFFGNTGTWAAAYTDVACTKPLNDTWPVIWLTRDTDQSPLSGGLMHWKDGRFLS